MRIPFCYTFSDYQDYFYEIPLSSRNIELMYEINRETMINTDAEIYVLSDNILMDKYKNKLTSRIENINNKKTLNINFSSYDSNEINIINDKEMSKKWMPRWVYYNNIWSEKIDSTIKFMYKNYPHIKNYLIIIRGKSSSVYVDGEHKGTIKKLGLNSIYSPLYSINNYELYLLTKTLYNGYNAIPYCKKTLSKEYFNYLLQDIGTNIDEYMILDTNDYKSFIVTSNQSQYDFDIISVMKGGMHPRPYFLKIKSDTFEKCKTYYKTRNLSVYSLIKSNINDVKRRYDKIDVRDVYSSGIIEKIDEFVIDRYGDDNEFLKLRKISLDTIDTAQLSEDLIIDISHGNFSTDSPTLTKNDIENMSSFSLIYLYEHAYSKSELKKLFYNNYFTKSMFIFKRTNGSKSLEQGILDKLLEDKVNDEFIDYLDKLFDAKMIINKPPTKPIKVDYSKYKNPIEYSIYTEHSPNINKLSSYNFINNFNTTLIKMLYLDKDFTQDELNLIFSLDHSPFKFLLTPFVIYSKHKYKSFKDLKLVDNQIKLSKLIRKSSEIYFKNIIKTLFVNYIFESTFGSGMLSNSYEIIKENISIIDSKIKNRTRNVEINNKSFNIFKDEISMKDIIFDMLNFINRKIDTSNIKNGFINNILIGESVNKDHADAIEDDSYISKFQRVKFISPINEIIKLYILKNILPRDYFIHYSEHNIRNIIKLFSKQSCHTCIITFLYYFMDKNEFTDYYNGINYDLLTQLMMNIEFLFRATGSSNHVERIFYTIPNVYENTPSLYSIYLKLIREGMPSFKSSLLVFDK